MGVIGFVVPGPEQLFGIDTYHFRLASGLMRELSGSVGRLGTKS